MTAILKVDTIQDTAGNNIINESSDTITIGGSGDTTNIIGTLQNNGSALAFGSLTQADQWRLTADLAGNNYITTNLERSDTYGAGYIGDGMTESSGVFTFPATGIYKVEFNPQYKCTGDDRVIESKLYTTTDGTNYNVAAYGHTSLYRDSSNARANSFSQIMFDVTNTSTHKVKFYSEYTNQSTSMLGSTSANQTTMTFIRLGDT